MSKLRLLPFLLLAFAALPDAPAQDRERQKATPADGGILESIRDRRRDKVEFVGNRSFTEAELEAPLAESIRDVLETGVTPARADDLAFYVGSFYRKAGFSKVEVDYQIRGGRIFIQIREGPRTLLRDITFVGNRAFPEEKLYEYMVGATPERLAREPAKFPYTSAEISAGADRVRGFYLSEGYLKVTVDASQLQISAGGREASVTVRIVEGPRYTVGEIRLTGDPIFPRDEVLAAVGEPLEGPFAPGKEVAMDRHLQSFYKTRGYYQAVVTPTADVTQARSGRVPITFHVEPGPLFRFGPVVAKNESGRPRLRPDFLPKRFDHLRGQVYDPAKLDEVFREMLRTGLFENLRVAVKPVGDRELQIDLVATEAKAKEIGFTIGAGSYEGASVGIRLGDRNFLGYGRPLSLAADASQRGLRGELLYVDPWLFDTRFALRAKLYSESRQEEGYYKNAYGARVDLTRKVLPHLELGTFVDVSRASIKDATIDPALLGPLDYELMTVGVTQNTDFRNDPLNPTRGFVFATSLELSALDNEAAFTRSIARFSYYLPLGKGMLAFGARVGMISPILEDLPIDIRFFNGGATTVRSFAERELGPKDSGGNPLGGFVYTVYNLEYTFPIKGAFQGAVFADAGSLKNDEIEDSGELRYALGLGLRYLLPIGPLRLDYGVNPNPREHEDFGAFHFSFGFAF